MNNKFYAGIGSRKTPQDVLGLMTNIAKCLDKHGYILRSGGAYEADLAFESGAVNKQIFRPYHSTDKAIEIASKLHPAWHKCNDYVRKLHGRNVQILLGENLNMPAEFVVCWGQ